MSVPNSDFSSHCSTPLSWRLACAARSAWPGPPCIRRTGDQATSNPQASKVVFGVAQAACGARRENLEERVFGIGRDLERHSGGVFLEPVTMAGARDRDDV